MDQPQTHYQVSFTVRQALLLFVGLLLALGIAYFLGLMTGLSGRPSEGSTASRESGPAGAAPKPESRAASAAPSPAPATSPAAETKVAAAEPTAPAELQMFEDAGGPTPTPPPRRILARGVTPPPPAAASGGEFWVQVLSVSSEREAKHRTDALKHHRFPAVVVAGNTEKGRVYRVRVGPYRSREDAERGAAALKSREKMDAWIVPAGQ